MTDQGKGAITGSGGIGGAKVLVGARRRETQQLKRILATRGGSDLDAGKKKNEGGVQNLL